MLDQLYCLADNIYFEARGEPILGQKLVAIVTLNRVYSTKFPNTICKVVWQKYQFSWTHDTISNIPKNKWIWLKSYYLAFVVWINYSKLKKYHNLYFFHNVKINKSYKFIIGNHKFK